MPCTTIREEKCPYLSYEIERIMPDIPRIKSEESSNIYSDGREEDRESGEYPCESSMIVDIPLSVDELERRVSRYQSCERHRRYVDDIEVDHLMMFVKMHEIGEDIETIRQEKYPEKEHEPLHTSLPCSISECENIREKCEDQIPYKTTEIYRVSDIYSYD